MKVENGNAEINRCNIAKRNVAAPTTDIHFTKEFFG